MRAQIYTGLGIYYLLMDFAQLYLGPNKERRARVDRVKSFKLFAEPVYSCCLTDDVGLLILNFVAEL